MSAIYRQLGKRLFDIALVSLTAPVWLPVVAAVAVIVRIRIGTPVLFRQVRPGRDGRLFTLLKFRTMTSARDERGALLPDHMRLTALGRMLRECSLDELPERLVGRIREHHHQPRLNHQPRRRPNLRLPRRPPLRRRR